MDLGRMSTVLLIVILLHTINAACRFVYASEGSHDNSADGLLLISFSSSPNIITTRLDDDSSKTISSSGRNSSKTNPHWDRNLCDTCHDMPQNPNSVTLSSNNLDDSCLDCHRDDIKHVYIHPVDISLQESRKKSVIKNWNGNLRLDENDRVTCFTCHDPLNQCLPERKHHAKLNPGFLRDGPYPTRYSLCYRCHDSEKYSKKNPHDQINESGLLKMKMCRLCHEVDINENIKSGISKDLDRFPLLEGMNEDRTLLCIRCHKKIDHPSSAFRVRSEKKYRHLVKIKPYNKNTLDRESNESGINLPLEPYTQRIYCGTCHQPHQPGVFSGEKFQPLPMENKRLRSESICRYCHDLFGSTSNGGEKQK